MWEYMKVPEDSREKVKNLLKDANENGVKISHQAPTLYDVVPKEEIAEIGRAHVCTPVTSRSRMPSSA